MKNKPSNLLIMVFVILAGILSESFGQPPAVLDSTITRDANGNGFLDRIELYFNKPVSIAPAFPLSNIFATSHGITFTIDSIIGLLPRGRTDAKFVLCIHEDSMSLQNVPQTGWTPSVSISGMTGAGPVSNFACIDGAGPVIWKVVKTISKTDDRTTDLVTVTFSERISGIKGVAFDVSTRPESVFEVYHEVYHNVLVAPGFLDSISGFARMVNDSILEFMMTNGKDLTPNCFLSILPAAPLADKPVSGTPNAPAPGNRNAQVAVRVSPDLQSIFYLAHNPSNVTLFRDSSITLRVENNPNARNWVRIDAAGFVFCTRLVCITDSSQKIQGSINIINLNGDTVQNSSNSDIRSSSNALSASPFDMYWNGLERNGRIAKDGPYKASFTVRYGLDTPVIMERPFSIFSGDISTYQDINPIQISVSTFSASKVIVHFKNVYFLQEVMTTIDPPDVSNTVRSLGLIFRGMVLWVDNDSLNDTAFTLNSAFKQYPLFTFPFNKEGIFDTIDIASSGTTLNNAVFHATTIDYNFVVLKPVSTTKISTSSAIAPVPPAPAKAIVVSSTGTRCRIEYFVRARGFVSLKIFDARGALVKDLVSGRHSAGQHIVSWDGTQQSGCIAGAGLYLVRLDVDGASVSKKILIAK